MKTLVVGSGSVGQVMARHLHLGGNQVAVLTRQGSAQTLPEPFVFYPLNTRRARVRPIRFHAFRRVTNPAPQPDGWEQVYICLPSSALRGGVLEEIGPHCRTATVVKLQPGLWDRRAYATYLKPQQMVSGMLSLLSYRAPLPGERVPEPGTAYWFPLLLPSLFSAEGGAAEQVVRTLRAGGFPARIHPDVEGLLAFVLAVEGPLMAGLECAGWSIRAFSRGRWFAVACRAIQEATAVAAAYLGVRPPVPLRAIGRTTLRLAIALLPRRGPVPLEAYLERHFTKLAPQSRQHLEEYIQEGASCGLPVDSLRELRRGLALRHAPDP